MYLNLMKKDHKGNTMVVVVVLNPLDVLGDKQVEEKILGGYSLSISTNSPSTKKPPQKSKVVYINLYIWVQRLF